MQENGFVRKKVNSLTLGERLRKVRKERGITLSEVADQTKIQLKYLKFIEDENYDKLPTEVYIKGFLRSYAKVLNINDENLIKLYKKEQEIRKNINQNNTKDSVIEKPIKYSKFVITPKIIIFTSVSILILLSFYYLFRELRLFWATPYLVIESPADGIELADKFLEVRGKTEKESELFINDQKILIDKDGNFQESINLQKGLNVISVRAVNRFGKESTKTVSVKGSFDDEQAILEESLVQSSFNQEESNNNEYLILEVSVLEDDVWLSIEADENIIFSGLMSSDEPKIFEADNQFKITSGKGDKTNIKLNGKENGLLSKKGGLVKDVIFNNENKE